MTVTINKEKMIAITNKIKKLMAITFSTIRQLASVIGSVISLFPAVPLEKLHYRAFDKEKTVALKKASGNFDKTAAKISVKAIDKLNWWLTEILHARRTMHLPDIDFTIQEDASDIGWGVTDGNNSTGSKQIEETGDHISYLELKAIYLAVKSYRRYWLGKKHI